MSRHILFVTSANLAINPRCLKEIRLAVECGHCVSVVKFNFNNWSDSLENGITNSLPSVVFYNISAGRTPFFPWAISTVLEKLAQKAGSFLPLSTTFQSYATGKRAWLIGRHLKKLTIRPDFVIAHNPAAFWPAYRYANKQTIPLGIDMEDYHPGEYKDEMASRSMLSLIKKMLPSALYVSFASPLIKKVTIEKVTGIKNGITINNCFEPEEFPVPNCRIQGKLKLVWFSQNIDFGRGLECMLPVLTTFAQEVELTLIGNLRNSFKDFLVPYKHFVTTLSPLAQKDLHFCLQDFDIGLAIEESRNNLNREVCLTNKIWSYFQSGLFILASSTEGQKEFLDEHSEHGIVCEIDSPRSLSEKISLLILKKKEIRTNKIRRYRYADNYSWQQEKQKLQDVWMLVDEKIKLTAV